MKIPLDQIDFAILENLQNNARLSNKELANRVHLAPSSCLERVRRLTGAGVFRGFHAEVDPAALGQALQAMITVRLRRHSRRDVMAFRAHLLALPEVLALFHQPPARSGHGRLHRPARGGPDGDPHHLRVRPLPDPAHPQP